MTEAVPDGGSNSTTINLAAAALSQFEQAGGGWAATLHAHAPLEAITAFCALPEVNQQKLNTLVEALLGRLDGQGAAALYPGGPPDAGACVLVYVVLKLAGMQPGAEPLVKLREHVLALGGLQAADAYTRLLLALYQLYPGEHLPALPSHREWARLPAWTRAGLLPLSLLHARHIAAGKPRAVPDGFSVSELIRADRPFSDPVTGPKAGLLSRLAGLLRPAPQPSGLPALPEVDGRLAPTPGVWLTQLCRGEQLPGSFVPAATPARDTALALLAHPSPPAQAAAWLRAQALPGGGWPRQFAAEMHSHAEETALALLALRRAEPGEPVPATPLAWLRKQQGRNGGWAACDAGLEEPYRPALPFPGAYAAADPACPALTGLALEALAACGAGPDDEAVRRGVSFLAAAQLERDGSWTSRWGVHYIHGTCFALRGLRAAGFDDHDAVVLRAGEWLRSIQNADGGWGESPASLDQGEFVEAPSNATQTAWAVLGLLAGGDRTSESVRRGVDYLFGAQTAGGGWPAGAPTMMHVPPSLFLANPLDAVVFPMLALREARS